MDAGNDHSCNGEVEGGVVDPASDGRQMQADVVEQRYRRLVDHSRDAIAVHEGGRVVYVNAAGVRWIGAQSCAELVGHVITEFVHPDSVPAMLARIASLRHEGDTSPPSEAVMLRFDGTTLDVEAVSVLTVWEGRPAYQVIFRDLSAQKAAEAALRCQAALATHVSDAIIATTFTGIVTNWNPAAEAIYRRPAARALALPASEAVGAALDPAAIIAHGGIVHSTHHAADGAALAVRVSATAMDNGYVLVCTDQTALRRAEQYFQTVVTTLDYGVAVIGSDGRIESSNPAAERMFGAAPRFSKTRQPTEPSIFPSTTPTATSSVQTGIRSPRSGRPEPQSVITSSASIASTDNGYGCPQAIACSTRTIPSIQRCSSHSPTSPHNAPPANGSPTRPHTTR